MTLALLRDRWNLSTTARRLTANQLVKNARQCREITALAVLSTFVKKV